MKSSDFRLCRHSDSATPYCIGAYGRNAEIRATFKYDAQLPASWAAVSVYRWEVWSDHPSVSAPGVCMAVGNAQTDVAVCNCRLT